MKETSTVSLILSIYNVEEFLQKCFESVRNQTYKALEIILIDDGSQDRSKEMCDEFASLDSRVKVVHKQNEGLGMARNTGLDFVTGDYVMFIDSDDWIDEYMVETLVNTAQIHNADMVGCGFRRFSSKGRIEDFNRTKAVTVFNDHESIITTVIPSILGSDATKKNLDGREMSVCTGIYKREIIKKFHLKFASERVVLTEDFFFNIQYLAKCESIVLLPDNLYYYRYNSDSLSRKYRQDKVQLLMTMTKSMIKALKDEGVSVNLGYRVERMYFKRLRNCLIQISSSSMKGTLKKQMFREAICADMSVAFSIIYPCRNVPIKEGIFVYLIKKRNACLLKAYIDIQRVCLRIIGMS